MKEPITNDLELKKAVLAVFKEIAGLQETPAPIFKDYVNEIYLPYFNVNTLQQHQQSELYRIKTIVINKFANKPMNQITENDLNVFMSNLREEREIGTSTMNRYRSRLVAIFNHAIKQKVTSHNPAIGLRRYKEQSRTRVLTPYEAKALLLACKESKNRNLYLITAIALYTAMRQGEILNLRINNIHDNLIRLEGSQTKSGYARSIPLHPLLIELLKKHIEKNNCKDKLFDFKSVKKAFNTAASKAYLNDFRFHDLRRTSATFMKDQNSNLYAVSDILGHSSLAMTEKYLVSNYGEMVKAINSLPSLL